ncbi:SMI1/KNR4 family protein [Streptomyces sp. NPDC048659]|uniref:SMI1/KNR4 family protein n=1 Tax=Streptomyces sp. NPDC048659 TaxID=3155489 RepID=UPI00341688B6
MDPRIPRLRRKLAAIPYQPLRSHSFGEERHEFRLGPRLPESRIARYEAEHGIELPDAYRQFLMYAGGTGAGPFYGLMPMERCSPLVMNPRGESGAPRGFQARQPAAAQEGDLFLGIIEMGCSDVCAIALTGPLTGRVLIGNSEGFWGPNVSSAADFIDWYERWLDQMNAGRDNRALHLTSPRLQAHPHRYRMAPRI